MPKKLILFLQYLHGVLVFTAIFAGLSQIFALFQPDQTAVFLRMFIIFLPFFATSFAARHVRSIFTFLLISLMSMVPVFFVASTIIEKVVFLLISMIIMIIRIVGRVREDSYDALMNPFLGVLALFVILYIVGVLSKNDLNSTVNYYLVFGYTILIIIYKNVTQLEGYLEYNSSVENIPTRQIRKNNRLIISVFLAMVIAAMIFLPMTGASQLIVYFWYAIRAGLRFIASLFSGGSETTEIPPETEAAAAEQMSPGMMDVTETPAWLTALYDSLSLALGVVVGLLILVALVTAIYKLIKKFYRPSFDNNDEAVFLDPLGGSDSMDRMGRRERPLWLSFDPNAVIRKQYRKMIKKGKKLIDRSAYTPTELEEYAEIPESEHRSRLHGLYEKARYSQEGCTKEDVQSLKG